MGLTVDQGLVGPKEMSRRVSPSIRSPGNTTLSSPDPLPPSIKDSGDPSVTAGPISPSVRDPAPFTVSDPRCHPPLRVFPVLARAGSHRGTAGIPERHAAVVERVLTPSPGRRAGAGPGGGGAAWLRALGAEPAVQGPGGLSGHGRRRPPAYIPRLNLGCARSSSPSGTRFRRRRLGPAPARAAPIRLGRARPRPAEPSPPARAPTSPASGSLSPVSRIRVSPGSQPWR